MYQHIPHHFFDIEKKGCDIFFSFIKFYFCKQEEKFFQNSHAFHFNLIPLTYKCMLFIKKNTNNNNNPCHILINFRNVMFS